MVGITPRGPLLLLLELHVLLVLLLLLQRLHGRLLLHLHLLQLLHDVRVEATGPRLLLLLLGLSRRTHALLLLHLLCLLHLLQPHLHLKSILIIQGWPLLLLLLLLLHHQLLHLHLELSRRRLAAPASSHPGKEAL